MIKIKEKIIYWGNKQYGLLNSTSIIFFAVCLDQGEKTWRVSLKLSLHVPVPGTIQIDEIKDICYFNV